MRPLQLMPTPEFLMTRFHRRIGHNHTHIACMYIPLAGSRVVVPPPHANPNPRPRLHMHAHATALTAHALNANMHACKHAMHASLHVQEALLASKLDAIAAEYNHLLASQLDSQRLYFEGLVAQVGFGAGDRAGLAWGGGNTSPI